jgi:hypothetical protein
MQSFDVKIAGIVSDRKLEFDQSWSSCKSYLQKGVKETIYFHTEIKKRTEIILE